MRRVGKGFSKVDTPLFDGMLVPQQVQVDIDAAAEDEDAAEPTPHSPTPATTPPPQQELISSPPQAETTRPPSPHQSSISQPSLPPPQPPSQPEDISHSAMALLNQLLEICATLIKKVGDLEQDKIAQAIKITKLKQRVRRLEKKRRLKASGFKRLRKGRLEESQAHVYLLDLEHAQKVLKVVTVAATTAATTITAALMPKASAPRRRRGVIIHEPKETTTPSVIMHYKPKSKDKGKRILVEEPKPLKRQAHIEQDKAYARKLEVELNANINWNEVIEQESKESKRKSESFEEKAAKKQRIAEEVEELKTHLQIVPINEDDVYTEATPLALKIIQERFASLEPKNFSDDFLLNTLKIMFEKPDVEANIWKNQKGSYCLAKVKSWKLLESYEVYIITFITTRMILLVERRYPLTRFTLEQMLNNVRLEVEEESEVSLELLRFVRRQQQERYKLK
uniref:Uncharacterized protein n=1 Tax=Tanacetum cinerariifolium TaxID=118510 RepID=A0A699KWA7_TANCI|nr:hypothetical protein [Tanacetum cinerariifolium]